MRNLTALALIALLGAGCTGGSDAGQAPPPRAPMTEADKAAMPPEAKAAMEAAQQRGAQTEQTRGQVGAGR